MTRPPPRCSSPDPKNQKLVLQRVGGFQEGMTNPCNCGPCRPQAGRVRWGLGQDKLLTLTAAEQEVKQFPPWPSVWNPRAACPAKGPTGPVLFRGTHPAHAVNKKWGGVNPAGWAARTR